MMQVDVDQIKQMAEVQSQTELPGGRLTRWVRTKWLNVAARWYVQEIFAQQNQFNHFLVNVLVKEIAVKKSRLNEQERDLTCLLRQADELADVIGQLRQRVADLEGQLENKGFNSDS